MTKYDYSWATTCSESGPRLTAAGRRSGLTGTGRSKRSGRGGNGTSTTRVLRTCSEKPERGPWQKDGASLISLMSIGRGSMAKRLSRRMSTYEKVPRRGRAREGLTLFYD